MPVTAKLSKAFYDRLGEEVANELVDWFNLVDATYRADLRELNELNFARFDARVEQRLVSLEARLNARIDTLEARLSAKLDTKFDTAAAEHAFAQLNAKIDAKLDTATAEQAFAQLHAKLDTKLDKGVAEHAFAQLHAKLDTKLDSGIAEHALAQLDAKIDRTAAQLTATMEQRFSRQVMWLLGAWALLITSIVPLWFRG
jgi:hypothetical protein